jgi:hypothetical protein
LGDRFEPADLTDQRVVVIVLSPRCPFVKHFEPELGFRAACLAGLNWLAGSAGG